ncbi:PH domain-containing protein [Nocardia puris]|nr:PH domain-containing protein [Nocardia puris]MBF6210841.1 PH domain-containing protein [Nocardia puris]MBF6364436.1 PH domain-containing protein [Nocardia puris]MBF6459365.1 PH domain-containing protein [Nocardia puris]
MLLVHPVTEVVKFIPVLIGSVILGTSSGNPLWSVIPLIAIVGFALTRWFTTTYRVGPTHVELRTGLVQRRKLSVPRSRIRSVDIESDLLHRALGLSVVVIGTGQQAEGGEKFELDALDARVVPALRTELLAHTAVPAGAQQVSDSPAPGPEPEGREIGHWEPGWVRYAPLSLTGFAVVAPIVGLAFQYGLGERVFDSDAAHDIGERAATGIVIAIGLLVGAVVLIVSLAACARYLATYHGLRVVDSGRTLHIRHGLFTTRQITLDLARFRGATVNEPLLLRWSGAAELEAIMVGENPRQKILPQAPREAVERTLSELLGPRAAQPAAHVSDAERRTASTPKTPDAQGDSPALPQMAVPLTPHGPAARRRRYTRALALPALVALAVLVLSVTTDLSVWWWLLPLTLLALAIALAEDRYRGLGHAVLPRTPAGPAWLITRSGSLDRDRDCLESPGVIGWTVRQTFWQRRAGLSTVVAATAAGKKRYLVIDIPVDQAWTLIDAVTPGHLGNR